MKGKELIKKGLMSMGGIVAIPDIFSRCSADDSSHNPQLPAKQLVSFL
ncbi:hypothetical protein SAMN04488028_10145 [Reichenbachiella agariperforans]|uniref:Uncharacterized protein n=1 Tax=Reichenbachiella agariperforans TaxID=156994 RepID=A0A1M6J520_REIAG|nr:hypothetical protein SAMN04488028_10145 [Reichenbachiella agariperforans]